MRESSGQDGGRTDGRQTGRQIGRQWLTVGAIFLAIAINAISNVYPPAGKNNGEVANITLGGVLITPANYAFAIWGLIYIGLIAYAFYQVLPAQRHNATFAKISWAIIGACLFQTIWLYVFLTYQFWLSVVFMLGILACLAFAYVQSRSLRPTRKVRWLLQAPISVYFAWITVAAVVNIAGAIYAMAIPSGNIETFAGIIDPSNGGVLATVIMMCVSAGIAAFIGLKFHDAAYPAVLVWSLSAIAIRHARDWPSLEVFGVGLSIALSVLIVRILTTRGSQATVG
jgi:hypothetical protein